MSVKTQNCEKGKKMGKRRGTRLGDDVYPFFIDEIPGTGSLRALNSVRFVPELRSPLVGTSSTPEL